MIVLYVFSLPGIFVALALRFDVSRGKDSQYFKSAFLGYTAGVVLTIIVMNWFQAAQVTRLDILFCFSSPFLYGQDHHPLIAAMPWYCYFQPALLYIVPAAIGFLAAHVIWNGDIKPVCSIPSMTLYLLLALTIILFYFLINFFAC